MRRRLRSSGSRAACTQNSISRSDGPRSRLITSRLGDLGGEVGGRPVLSNPANRHRAVPLTYEQFRFGFANAVDEDEAKELYETYAVPGSGTPIFQAAAANLNPWTEAKVDTKTPERGPLLIIAAEKDNTVPPVIANASYKKQKRNDAVTESTEIAGRGHALVVDSGWREPADASLAFVKRFAVPDGSSPGANRTAAVT